MDSQIGSVAFHETCLYLGNSIEASDLDLLTPLLRYCLLKYASSSAGLTIHNH